MEGVAPESEFDEARQALIDALEGAPAAEKSKRKSVHIGNAANVIDSTAPVTISNQTINFNR